MKCRPIFVDDSLRELTQHGTRDFPLSMDRQAVADPSHGNVRHWHPEIQIALVTEGAVIFRTEAGEFRLEAGEGFFVNSGVLHEAGPAEIDNGVYICINFLPSVLYGQGDSVLRRDYVDPVLSCEALRSFPLRDLPWHREACALLRQLGETEEAAEYGYELQMVSLLCRLWHLLVTHNREAIEQGSSVSFTDRQRVRALQTYLHKHYMDRVTLADIAAAGHISPGECCRAFRRVLQMTPVQYLTQCRLDQSVRLLTHTALSVGEIAGQVGYGTASYFTELFRREMGCTPREYRRRHRQAEASEKLSES